MVFQNSPSDFQGVRFRAFCRSGGGDGGGGGGAGRGAGGGPATTVHGTSIAAG